MKRVLHEANIYLLNSYLTVNTQSVRKVYNKDLREIILLLLRITRTIRSVPPFNTYCVVECCNAAVGGAYNKHTALKVWERKRN